MRSRRDLRRPALHAAVGVALLGTLLLAGCTEGGDADGFNPRRQETRARFDIPSGEGYEWKVYVREGDTIQFAWNAGTSVFYDFHGDTPENTRDFTTHKKGSASADQGAFTAPFTGRHGWYWENRSRSTAGVEVEVSGVFDTIGRTG